MSQLNQIVLVLTTLLALLVAGGMAQEDAARAGLRPDAPAYALRGAHPVGTSDLVVDGATSLPITLWYPALNAEGVEETTTYSYEIKMDAPPDAVASVAGRAIRDAPRDLSKGPYPLVILSPGFTIGRTSYAWLAEHLASLGFVVIAPEHKERFDEEMSDFWRVAVTRPRDVVTVLDYAEREAEAGGALAGFVNTELVAVVGHSYGGYTALMAAGARFDMASFETLCETARAAEDPNAWLCDPILPNLTGMTELAGLESLPENLWPTWGDERVDAVVSMAGDAYLFGQAGLAGVTVPVLALGGTADTGTPYAWGTQPTFEHVSSPRKAKVAFENAEHMIFASSCEALPWFANIGFYAFCSDAVWDMDRAHDLSAHFVAAFLLAELTQDTEAATVLAPDKASFSGVIYEAQGY